MWYSQKWLHKNEITIVNLAINNVNNVNIDDTGISNKNSLRETPPMPWNITTEDCTDKWCGKIYWVANFNHLSSINILYVGYLNWSSKTQMTTEVRQISSNSQLCEQTHIPAKGAQRIPAFKGLGRNQKPRASILKYSFKNC